VENEALADDSSSYASQLEIIQSLLAWKARFPDQITIKMSDKKRPESTTLGAGAVAVMHNGDDS
jgi:hypothetical protein